VIAGMTAAAQASAGGIDGGTGTVIGACVLAWLLYQWAGHGGGGHGGGHGRRGGHGGRRRGGGHR
jgi:hypothetical protein